jgi:transglutaminase-like putative cysteine protease
MMEPLGTNVVFLVSRPEGLTGRFRELAIDSDNTVQNLDNGRTATEYGGYSDISEPVAKDLQAVKDRVVPADIPERYLQLPKLDPRLVQLAHQIADTEPTPYLKAAAIERYLSSRYSYTLELGSEATDDPLPNFLFQRKRGHCEYFASSRSCCAC